MYQKGQRVRWQWGGGEAHGRIVEHYTSRVTKTIKGTQVTRDASDNAPAYLIEQEDGDRVLKSQSELTQA